MVYRLTYVSGVSSPTFSTLPASMRDILLLSMNNNRRDGLTGFLLCDGDIFAQALEGEEALVERCFARILRDVRNVAPIVRERSHVASRAFPRWSMCALTLSPQDDALLTAPQTFFDLSRASAGALWQFLTSLAERHGPELDAEHDRLLRRAARR